MKEAIPSLARSLLKNSRELLDRNINLNVEFHRNGVNMRFIGYVRNALADLQDEAPDKDELSALLLREMIVQVCKKVSRQKM
jgi:hypothetical protein